MVDNVAPQETAGDNAEPGTQKFNSSKVNVKKKECPSCAMEIDARSKSCPICGYEFSDYSAVVKWVAIGLLLLFLLYFILSRVPF